MVVTWGLGLVLLLSPVYGKYVHIETGKCGYPSCPVPKEGFINVHLIPHTHDDVGWLKTLDQYYYGSKSKIQLAGVQYILDSVVQQLKHDPNKRFIYVETAFFWKWWQQQADHERHIVKRLVANGQLEFIGGAWSMHDEATTHYQSIIDQFTWGFRKLNDTFGECGVPKVGWQIDPFGHSRETASIMARLGFDGLFVGRIDYMDKATRLIHKDMEMIWEASPNLGKEADLFTGVLFNTYSAPKGFCFDILCEDEPVIDDKKSPDYNADKRATQFRAEILARHLVYHGSNIAVAMGDDFNFQAAHIYFANIDRLITAVNSQQVTNGSNINLMYSTPSCYLKALNDEKLQWSTKQDDFFPYASDPHSFWTGYFTSRPTLKYYERIGNNFLQVCKQLYTLSNLGPEVRGDLNVLREAMGVMQHHDAVSGTEKQHVASDYARLLSKGLDECGIITESAFNKLMAKTASTPPVVLNSCMLFNISQCETSESHNTFVVTLYNPLSRNVSRYIRLPVSGDGHAYTVQDPQGQSIPVQIVPVPEPVVNVPGRFSDASVELVFRVVDLPPLGFRSYYVSPSNTLVSPNIIPERTNGRQFTVGHKGSLRVTIDSKTGLPTTIHGPGFLDSPDFQQNFYYYESAVGNNEVPANRSSGAYIFRPNSTLIMINSQPTIKYYKGEIVEELHQQFSSWVSQVIRAYKGENHLEFIWMVGPIPTSDKRGKEVVTKYSVYGMDTNSTFYTDSNGREMLRRVMDERPTYTVKLEEPLAGNYYPVNTRISVQDPLTRFSIITDRSQGGTSMHNGDIELMLHRRMLHDDAFGVGEALNEEAFGRGLVARGTHLVIGGPSQSQTVEERRLVQERVLAAWTFLTPTRLTFDQWRTNYNMEFSGLQKALPDNVQILTLEPWKGTTFLLRLEHVLEKDDDKSAADPVIVNLQEIFKPFSIKSIRETSLGANQWLNEVSRLVWKKKENRVDNYETLSRTETQDLPNVTLTPMSIKTFIIDVSFQNQ
ncbi:lysosomal alpha-mannosidase isoform X2 [Macrosteles quadrilineatus]|uniref:lysosomal alpha-mannosidase isoform X2 n=1 Tax=Macrosteles quadrilineatus TaxID=74068 RepID=UPI0023E15F10|nr:lysosomal alpha-mannosidase isoform X2 [Macrosteles quadrilineatus]